jgi:hypothetical protein
LAQAGKFASDAKLSEAKAADTLADAHLKTVQAEVLSKAPKVPSGLGSADVNPELQAANDVAVARDKNASADLKHAQADHLQHDMHMRRLKTGAEIEQMQHGQRMAERAQEHSERQTDAA